jgi:uncharacterized protein (DUF1778 family)
MSRLDEARAEIRRLKAPVAVWEERLGAARAEIARLRVPSEEADDGIDRTSRLILGRTSGLPGSPWKKIPGIEREAQNDRNQLRLIGELANQHTELCAEASSEIERLQEVLDEAGAEIAQLCKDNDNLLIILSNTDRLKEKLRAPPEAHPLKGSLTEVASRPMVKQMVPIIPPEADAKETCVINMRASAETKQLLQNAAADENKTLTDFIMGASLQTAREVLATPRLVISNQKSPEADAMQIAHDIIKRWPLTTEGLARALTAYGDQRASEAVAHLRGDDKTDDEIRDAVRKIDARPLRRILEINAREARAAAFEEADQGISTMRLHSNDFSEAEMDMFERGVQYALRVIRALAAAPPQSEGGEG